MKKGIRELWAMGAVLAFLLIVTAGLMVMVKIPFQMALLSLAVTWFCLIAYLLPAASPVVKTLRKPLQGPGLFLAFTPLLLVGMYCLVGKWVGLFSSQGAWIYLAYIGVPILIGLALRRWKGKLTMGDLVIILIIWYPVEFGLLPKFHLPPQGDVRLPLHFFMALLPALYLFLITRELDDLGFRFDFTRRDLLTYLGGAFALTALLIPLGFGLDFIRYKPRNPEILEALGVLVGIFFFTALPEEFLFRGLFHNLVDKWCGRPKLILVPLLISSIVFGLTHLNNGNVPNWRYAIMATVAGFFYGWVYIRTKSLAMSALLHTTVNFLWFLLFATVKH